MKPTDILMREHRVIEQVLNCLEKMAERCETEGVLDKKHSKDAVDFFRGFADRCHHGKEEVHLFPMMESRGFPRGCGPTDVMRYEHDQGRSHIRAMDEAINAASAGGRQAMETFVREARAYVALLRQHIQKEDTCLFPMANQAMSDEDQQTLMGLFDKVEREEIGQGVHEKRHAMAEELARHYGVAGARFGPHEGDHGPACSH